VETQRQTLAQARVVEISVMRENVHRPTELAGEGLAIR
jgi:hypothetical protein